jgi:hypothetical protein
MKWLMMLVAIVLGAGITWLLTVRRVTRQVTPGDATAPEPGETAARDETAREEVRRDEAAREEAPCEGATPGEFAPGETVPGETASDDERVDDAAGFGGAVTQESSSLMGWDRTSQDEDALFPHEAPGLRPEAETVPPIAGATPHGDLAGVTAPRAEGVAEPEPAGRAAADVDGDTPAEGGTAPHGDDDPPRTDPAHNA